jgi:hypothetical protein
MAGSPPDSPMLVAICDAATVTSCSDSVQACTGHVHVVMLLILATATAVGWRLSPPRCLQKNMYGKEP